MEKEKTFVVPEKISFFAIGLTIYTFITFAIQGMIYLTATVPNYNISASGITTFFMAILWSLFFISLFKKLWPIALGILFGTLINVFMNFPFIFAS